MIKLFVPLTLFVAATACGGEQAPPTQPTQATAPPAAPVPTPARVPSWELTVGEASFSGPSVMSANTGLFVSHALATDGFSATFSLLKDHTSEPHTAQFLFTNAGEMCVYRDDNKNVSSGLKVEKAGDRYVVSGEIGCGPAQGGAKQARAVQGFFQPKK